LAQAPVDGPGPERDRICDALVDLVAARGYQSTSVDQVVDRAGVDRAAFTRHFDSLEDCFAAAWERVDAELSRRMAAAFGRRDDWQDRLRDALEAGLRYLATDESQARLFVAEVTYVNDQMRDRQRDAMTRLSATIDRGRVDALDGDRASPEISDAISGAIWHRVHQLVQSGRGAELPDEVSHFMYIAVLPYRGAAAAEAELSRS
jgi:AcrR family transcriptional regulator